MTLVMALLLAAAGPGTGDDETIDLLPVPRTMSIEETQDEKESHSKYEREDARFGLSLGVSGSWILPFGYANRDTIVVDNPFGGITIVFDGTLQWSDCFSSGWGTAITAEFTMVQAGRGAGSGRGRSNFTVGGFISFAQATLSGDRASDDAGNSFRPDDLTLNTYIVGATMFQSLGNGVFADGRLGLGAVHYSQVDATYNFKFVPEFRSTFLEDTWNFAMEVRGGGGYRFGPLAITLGVGFRMLLPPAAGDTVDLDSGILFTIEVDLGVEIGF